MKLLSTVVFTSALLAAVPAFACGDCGPVVKTSERGHGHARKHCGAPSGKWVLETQQVTVPGRWEMTPKKVLVSPGHYEVRSRTVTVPGRWVNDPCACRSHRRGRHRSGAFTVSFGRHAKVQFGRSRHHRCAPQRRWIPPTCKQINEKVWVNPVYQTRSCRTWIPARVETQQVRVWMPTRATVVRYPRHPRKTRHARHGRLRVELPHVSVRADLR